MCEGHLTKTFLSIFSHSNKIAQCFFCGTTKYLCIMSESCNYAVVSLFLVSIEISISRQNGKKFVEWNSFISSENCLVSDEGQPRNV